MHFERQKRVLHMHDMQFAIERLIRGLFSMFHSTSTMNVNSFRRTENRKEKKSTNLLLCLC